MSSSQWHKYYSSDIAACPGVLFELLSDLPNYSDWLPNSDQFKTTTDVEPYPFGWAARTTTGGQTRAEKTGGAPLPDSRHRVLSTFTVSSG